MAFGDAWGHDGRTYDGKEMRQLVAALTGGQQGVVGLNALKVSQQAAPTSTVKVAAGEAVIRATGAGLGGSYMAPNDADLTSPSITATGAQVRTDRLIVRITGGVPALEVVAGTAGSATPPTVTGDNYLPLAQIVLPVATSNITDAMIVDERPMLGERLLAVATATDLPSGLRDGVAAYILGNSRPSGAGIVAPHSSVPASPGLWVYDGRWNPPWNLPWGVMAYAEVVADQAGISTLADLTGLSVTFTAAANRRLRISGEGLVTCSAEELMVGYIRDGAGTQLGRWCQQWQRAGSAGTGQKAAGSVVESPSAGSVTYKLSLERNTGAAGTVTLQAGATHPAFILVEDLGPANPPA